MNCRQTILSSFRQFRVPLEEPHARNSVKYPVGPLLTKSLPRVDWLTSANSSNVQREAATCQSSLSPKLDFLSAIRVWWWFCEWSWLLQIPRVSLQWWFPEQTRCSSGGSGRVWEWCRHGDASVMWRWRGYDSGVHALVVTSWWRRRSGGSW